jgi:hypothetical protein
MPGACPRAPFVESLLKVKGVYYRIVAGGGSDPPVAFFPDSGNTEK